MLIPSSSVDPDHRRALPPLWSFALLALVSLSTGFAQQPTPRSSVSAQNKTRVSASSPFGDAEALLAQGKLDDARARTEELLNAHPDSVEGYNLLGIIEANSKNYAAAEKAFQHALELNPSSARTHTNLGDAYAAQLKLDRAEAEFKAALRLETSNRGANYNLGLLLMAKGSPQSAIPYLQRVRPADSETRFNLLRAYLRSGNTREGLALARQISDPKPADVQLHFTLGILLASENQFQAAKLELEKARALRPDAFEILYSLGQAYQHTGELKKAELTMARAVKLKPESPDALYMLGKIYSAEDRPLDALDVLVPAHKLVPENADIIFLMARVSMTQNYFEDAIPLLESGLKIAPQRADLHAALGESYFMAGQAERAIEAFKKLVEFEPSARSYTFLGLSYRHLGRFDESRKYFEEGLKRDPKNAACLFNLGYIDERQGNTEHAESMFQAALRSNPEFSDALLELANLRNQEKKYAEAVDLLRRYVKVSHDPAAGYYKLAMIERSLHQTEAAQRDLNVFQTLSKNSSTGPYPYQHLFEYLDNRSKLTAQERTQFDVAQALDQIKKHPGQALDLYVLAEGYLKLGSVEDARKAASQIDELAPNDYRTQTGVGVLFARYHQYDDAIQHFQAALRANPESDEAKFDLANAYFRKGAYPDALEAAQKISAAGQDDSYLSLLGDIYAHLGDTTRSEEIIRDAISRNPDNDQYYLSLSLVQLRAGEIAAAEQTIKKGLDRVPSSGKLQWGMGLISAVQGNTRQAADRLERAVELLPEWVGSYSTLGVFYYQTGQIGKAREVLDRFKGSKAGGLDVGRIEQTLSRAPANTGSPNQPLPMDARRQLLQLALSIADRTL